MNLSGQDLQTYAALNNAELCELVCASNGVSGNFSEQYWSSLHTVADYYPNFVSLKKDIDQDEFKNAISNYAPSRSWTVKDSFNNVDLKPLGFDILFDAEWIVAPNKLPTTLSSGASWKIIGSTEELLKWEAAWANKWTPQQATLFKPSLLAKPEITFIGAYLNDEIIAGVLVNKSEKVTGFSNLFVNTPDTRTYWIEALDYIKLHFPLLPVVGYERDSDLIQAREVGFEPIGVLRVWIKQFQ